MANQSNEFQESWIRLGMSSASGIILFNPLTGKRGIARTKEDRIFLQLAPGQSCFIKLYNDGESFQWEYSEQIASYRIDGNWNVSFKEGSPQLPASYII